MNLSKEEVLYRIAALIGAANVVGCNSSHLTIEHLAVFDDVPTGDASGCLDEFSGDNTKLVGCIEALLSMDKAGVLVPHGIGGHARHLLSAAACRITALTAPDAPTPGDVAVDTPLSGDHAAARVYIRDWCPDHVKDYIATLTAGVRGDAVAFAWAKPNELQQYLDARLHGGRFGLFIGKEPDQDCTVPLYTTPQPARADAPAVVDGWVRDLYDESERLHRQWQDRMEAETDTAEDCDAAEAALAKFQLAATRFVERLLAAAAPTPPTEAGKDGGGLDRALRKVRARADATGTVTTHGKGFADGLRCAANMIEAARVQPTPSGENGDD